MNTKMRRVPAGEFKAKCLSLLDDVAQTGRPILVTKRGKPVAQVIPASEQKPASLRGSVLWEKDLISPIDEPWDADA